MHLVPAPAVRLMKRRVLSRPGVNSLMLIPTNLLSNAWFSFDSWCIIGWDITCRTVWAYTINRLIAQRFLAVQRCFEATINLSHLWTHRSFPFFIGEWASVTRRLLARTYTCCLMVSFTNLFLAHFLMNGFLEASKDDHSVFIFLWHYTSFPRNLLLFYLLHLLVFYILIIIPLSLLFNNL